MSGDAPRLVRILKILELLHSGRAFTSAELAVECRCSRRTIFRDLNLIRKSGIPIFFDSSLMGYTNADLTIRRGQTVNPRLTEAEYAAIAIACELSLAPEEYLSEARRSVCKLSQEVRPDARLRIGMFLNSCSMESTETGDEQSTIIALIDAILQHRYVRVSCFDGPNGFRSKFSPCRIVASQTGWKTFGRSSWHRRTIMLAVKDISDLELLDEFYERPR